MLRSADRQANLVATYADRIPMMAIATLLDAPVEDYHRYREWVDASLELITTDPSPARLDVLAETLADFDSFIRKLIHARRERSGEDAIRSQEPTSQIKALMRITTALFCLRQNT